jgi:hypothetical protein
MAKEIQEQLTLTIMRDLLFFGCLKGIIHFGQSRFINTAVTNFNRNRSGPNSFRLNFDDSVNIAVGSKWPVLNPESFEEDLIFLWNKVKAAIRIPLAIRTNTDAMELLKCTKMKEYKFHFFVFLPKIPRDMVNNRISQTGIRQAF